MEKAIVLQEAFKLFFEDEEEYERNSSRAKIVKNLNYAEEVVPSFSDITFKTHFRVNPDVFEMLCREIHSIEVLQSGPGREPLAVDKKLMISLWYLGNPESMRSIADRFGVCIASVFRIVSDICDSLIKLNRSKKFIKWPTAVEAARTSSYYRAKSRFPGIIGSIDGCHIQIRAPVVSHNSYINRKGFHSVLLQGICNHKMEFLYCYTGEAGSIHDALLLRRSGLVNKINTGDFFMTEDQHLLGDSAYPLKHWLITPFKDNGLLRDEQKVFNRIHSKCRVTIEQAFGLLKGRFRRLFNINSLKPVSIVKYIIASCILHNICIIYNDIDMGLINVDEEEYNEDDNDADSRDVQTGQSKRNTLMNALLQ